MKKHTNQLRGAEIAKIKHGLNENNSIIEDAKNIAKTAEKEHLPTIATIIFEATENKIKLIALGKRLCKSTNWIDYACGSKLRNGAFTRFEAFGNLINKN
jgi:hypothetical protein